MSDRVNSFAPSSSDHTTPPPFSEHPPSPGYPISPPPNKSEKEEEVFEWRVSTADPKFYNTQGAEGSTSEQEQTLKGLLEDFDDEIRCIIPDMLTPGELKPFLKTWYEMAMQFGKRNYFWNCAFLQYSSLWMLVLKVMTESKDKINDETTMEHHSCRRFLHVSRGFEIDARDFLDEYDGQHFIQLILPMIVKASNTAILMIEQIIKFYLTTEIGGKLLVVNGAIQKMRDRIAQNDVGDGKPHYADFRKLIKRLEEKEHIMEWITIRMKKAMIPRRDTTAHFSYYPQTCFLVASLELCTSLKDVCNIIMRNHEYGEDVPRDEKFALKIITCSMNVLSSHPSKSLHTGSLMEFLESKTLGLPFVRGFGGRTEVLMEKLIKSIEEIRQMFSFRPLNGNSISKGEVLRVERLEMDTTDGQDSYTIPKWKFKVLPQKLAVFFFKKPKPTLQYIPLRLESEERTPEMYKLKAFTTETMKDDVLHAIAYTKNGDEWRIFNMGKKEDFDFSKNTVDHVSFAIFEKEPSGSDLLLSLS